MKAILVTYDTLCRRFLSPYGNDWVKTPNFRRLADRALTFDTCFAGSLPTIPARRELHAGRYNFLHRGWGPLEPFDDSMPQLLRDAGLYTHLASDAYHYWEDGGGTYHGRYNSWAFFRGQESDAWIGQVADPAIPPHLGQARRQYYVNKPFMDSEKTHYQFRTFDEGLAFLQRNHKEDRWLLHIETFDPHEPWFSLERFRDLYPHDYNGPVLDWPVGLDRALTESEAHRARCLYAALVSQCDYSLGRVLDAMDQLDLWSDTMLIVNTDHGWMLGEHGIWGKGGVLYDGIAHLPLFAWDPRTGAGGERRSALVQTIDLPATFLEYFGLDLPAAMQGRPLRDVFAQDAPIRAAALFGRHGQQVNVTDGRFVYMRGPADQSNEPLAEYTLMPTRMRGFFKPENLRGTTLAAPFTFTKECPVLRVPVHRSLAGVLAGTTLFDLATDPLQERPIEDADIEGRMAGHLVRLMQATDAPPEQYERLRLEPPSSP